MLKQSLKFILYHKKFKAIFIKNIFEKHFFIGGYATNFKRKGYNFDVSLHGIGGLQEGGNPYNILKYCDVLDKIKPIKK